VNNTKPVYISVGINFSTWAIPTNLFFDFARSTYTYDLEGPRYSAKIERRFNSNDTSELRRLFGDELTDRLLTTWYEYHALPRYGEDIQW
jgi:hypothetical protein